jgi:hypothetical protein
MGASNSTEIVKSWREKRESELIKGQLILKGIFGVFKSKKKKTKFFKGFLP